MEALDPEVPLDQEDLDLVDAVREASAEARRDLDSHPSDEDLVAYHEHTLPEARAEEVEEHLSLCPECARRGLDQAVLLHPDLFGDDEGLSGEAEESGWASLHGALEEEGFFDRSDSDPVARISAEVDEVEGSTVPPAVHLGAIAHAFRSPRLAYAIAALFFVTTMVQSWRLVAFSRSQLPIDVAPSQAGIESLQANVALEDLYPDGSAALRDDSPAQSVTVSTPTDSLVLILNVGDPGTYPNYRVEIFDLEHSENKAIWSSDEPKLSSDDHFTVLVSRHELPAERYLIRLYGIEGARQVPLADYTFRFEAPP